MDAKVSQSEIPQLYDSLSKTYDVWGTLAETKARNRALELADIHDGQRILEVAVGTGLAFYEIVKKNPGGTNTGIDVSRGMLKKAEKRLLALSDANYKWISSKKKRILPAAVISFRGNTGPAKLNKKEGVPEVQDTNSVHLKYLKIWFN